MSRILTSLAAASALLMTFIGLPFPEPASAASLSNVAGWGKNSEGQLGIGTVSDYETVAVPTERGDIPPGAEITQVSSDLHQSCLIADGRAYCWGRNISGEIGDGTNTDRLVPTAVSTSGVLSGKTLVSISAGRYFTCAVDTDGVGYCWGTNAQGQLGTGNTTSSNVPVVVSGVHRWREISGGFQFSCGVTTSGSAYCWGVGASGQLGTGGTSNFTSPTAVDITSPRPATYSSIAAGNYHVCAIATTGGAYCWGTSFVGALGTGTITETAPTAVSTTGTPSNYTSISASTTTTCAVSTSNGAWCWGENNRGQVGDGTTTDATAPTQVFGLTSSVELVRIGDNSACALLVSGEARCWGANFNGNLGIGTTTSSYIPTSPMDFGSLRNRTIQGLSIRGDTVIALLELQVNDDPAQAPPPVLQQLPRDSDGTCTIESTEYDWSGVGSGGWSESWAEWAVPITGGPICTRTLRYASGTGRWVIAT